MKCIKLINNNRGSLYIFVLIIIMSITIIISIISNIAIHNFEIIKSHKENAYLYEYAFQGIENVVYEINSVLDEKRMHISEQTLRDVVNENIRENVYYEIMSLENKYNGDFYLKSRFSTNFENNANLYIRNERYEYEIENDSRNIKLEIWISVGAEVDITSRATNIDTGDARAVGAKVQMSGSGAEMIVPTYVWRSEPMWSEYGVFAKGVVVIGVEDEIEIEDDGEWEEVEISPQGYINVNYIEGGFLESYGMAFSENVEWSRENPVMVIKDFRNNIDVSNFYVNGEAIETAIIVDNVNLHEVFIYSSSPSQNTFRGVIYTKGNVTVDAVNIEGHVLSEGNVSILNRANLQIDIRAKKDSVFEINLLDKELKHRLYDYLKITEFNRVSSVKTEAESAINQILMNSDFANNATLLVDLMDNMYYKIIEINYIVL